MLYTLVFNTSEKESDPNSDTFKAIMVDSTANKNSNAETAIDSVTIDDTTKSKISLQSPISEEKLIPKRNYDPLKKQHQILKINTQNDTIIKCKEGTILRIAKRSFINPKTRQVVTGEIKLNVTEYYKLSDILMANLSTVSDRKQLETGGMLYVEAIQGNTKLELNETVPMQISFPNQNPKRGMQLFSGEWKDENINWELENLEELENLDISIEEIEEHIEVPFSVVEQVPTFPGCENDDNEVRRKCTSDAISKFISRKFNTDIALGLGLTGRQRINSIFKIDQEGNVVYVQSRASHPKLSQEADRVISSLPKMIPGMQRGTAVIVPYSLPITFKIEGEQTTGELTRSSSRGDTLSTSTTVVFANDIEINPIEMDTIYRDSRGIVETIREVMHDKDFPVDSLFLNEWRQYEKQNLIRIYGVLGTNSIRTAKLRKGLFELEDTKFKILEDDSITRGGHVIRKLWNATQIPSTQVMELVPKQRFTAGTEAVTAEEFESRIDDIQDRTISSRDASFYVLKSSKLGWINCDRFINGRTTRIKYKLKIKNADGANVNMVFKSINSILPSWHTNGVYDFQTVGANEDIVLVAIKRKDGKLYYDTVETKTKKNPKLDFDFKEVSLEELKKELEKLNSTFD